MNLQAEALKHVMPHPRPPMPGMNRAKEASKKIFVTSKATYVAITPDDLLGKGTYGVVYRVRNEKDPQDVKAVKTFTPETMDENEGIPPTTLREINALKLLQHPNILKAEEIVLPEGQQAYAEMFVVMELCPGTMKDKVCDMIQKHLKSDPKYYNFPAGKCPPGLQLPTAYLREAKLLTYQLLNGGAYMHSRGVIHRDLKPVNIMWGFDDLLKFGDFGLARFIRGNQNSKDNVLPITGEVQTMWYRAPEVLLGDETYGAQVDDWSIGCMIAELFRFRKSGSTNRVEPEPLFSGRSDPETLLMIFETIGTPNVDSGSPNEYLAKLPYWSSEFPKWETGTLAKRIPLLDQDGLDLVSQLLKVSPCERSVAKHLLNHRWFDDSREEIRKRFRPWCVGLEKGYEVMLAVDRLPLAQVLSDGKVEPRKEANGTSVVKGESMQVSNQVADLTALNKSNALSSASDLSSSKPGQLESRYSARKAGDVPAKKTYPDSDKTNILLPGSEQFLVKAQKAVQTRKDEPRAITALNKAPSLNHADNARRAEAFSLDPLLKKNGLAKVHENGSRSNQTSQKTNNVFGNLRHNASESTTSVLLRNKDDASSNPISTETKRPAGKGKQPTAPSFVRRVTRSQITGIGSQENASKPPTAWHSISRSRSPDRCASGVSSNATGRNPLQRRVEPRDKLPPNQGQLPFVRDQQMALPFGKDLSRETSLRRRPLQRTKSNLMPQVANAV